MVAQNVERGTGELVRNGFDRDDAVGLCSLLVVKPLGLGVVLGREVSGLDEGPRQILVAVLGVVVSLLLSIRESGCVDAAGVRSKVAGTGEAVHVASLVHDRQPEDLANASDGEQELELGAQARLGQDHALDQASLFGEYIDDFERRGEGKSEVFVFV